MALVKNPPNTIILGGGLPGGDQAGTKVNEYVTGVVTRPGMVVEMADFAGRLKYRPHATAGPITNPSVAVEKLFHNKGPNDGDYAVNELINVVHLRKGSTFWGRIAAAQTITKADYLESAGDGRLRVAAGETRLQALETLGAVAVDTFCRVMVL